MAEKKENEEGFLLRLWRNIAVDGRGLPASISAVGATILGGLLIAWQAGVTTTEMAELVRTGFYLLMGIIGLLLMTHRR